MCGIVSIFNLREQTPELRQKALRMSRKIRHRGPDWSGIWCGGSAILAHGEIYKHKDIRDRYKGKYEFQTGSDCEVILAL